MNESKDVAGGLASGTSGQRNGRRRFLGAGASATPALLTLVSQPALGTGVTCFTPSRSTSKNTSVSQQGKYGTCTGESVTTYAAVGSTWPSGSPSLAKSTPFHPFFGGVRMNLAANGGGNPARSLTAGEVMRLDPLNPIGTLPSGYNAFANGTPSAEVIRLARHIIAAHLNVLAGKVPPQVLRAVSSAEGPSAKSIWDGWNPTGLLALAANVSWNETQIKDYLISNGIAPV